jgi:hypothetical protein
MERLRAPAWVPFVLLKFMANGPLVFLGAPASPAGIVILLFCTTMTRGYLSAPKAGVIRG